MLFYPEVLLNPCHSFFSWSVIALQCRVSFCYTTAWVSYMYTYIPSLLSLPHFVIIWSFGFPLWMICKQKFYFFFSDFMLLYAFYFLVSLSGNSRTKLSKAGDCVNTCLAPSIRGRHLVSHHYIQCQAQFFHRCLLSPWEGTFLFSACWECILKIMNEYWNLLNSFYFFAFLLFILNLFKVIYSVHELCWLTFKC